MKLLLVLLILYLELTFCEVFIHKEIYHNKPDSFIRKYGIYGDEHINHHLDVFKACLMHFKDLFVDRKLRFSSPCFHTGLTTSKGGPLELAKLQKNENFAKVVVVR